MNTAKFAVPVPAFQPYKLGELLDQSFRLFRKNFLPFLGMIALVQIPASLLTLVPTVLQLLANASFQTNLTTTTDPASIFAQSLAIMGTSMVLTVLSILVTTLLIFGLFNSALCYSIAASYSGQPIGIVESYRKAFKIFPRVAGALLLAFLIEVAIFIWMVIPCIGWFSGIGLYYFFAAVVNPWITPIIIFEGRPAGVSIRRAWDLARKRFWWLVGVVFILTLLNIAFSSGPSLLITWGVQLLIPLSAMSLTARSILSTLSSSLVAITLSLLYSPLYMTMMIKMYIDTRVRTEGLDLAAQLAASAPSGEQAPANDLIAVLRQAPVAPTPDLITGAEVGYFVAFSFGAILIIVIIYGLLFGILFAAMAAGRSALPLP